MVELVQVASRRVEAVEETWHQFVPGARLDRADAETFRFRWDSATTGSVTVLDYRLSADVHASLVPIDQLFACQFSPERGTVGDERHDFDADRPWICPEEGVTAQWEGDARVRAFIFDRSYAESIAQQITGQPRLRLLPAAEQPRPGTAAPIWADSVDYVKRTLMRSEGHDEPLIEAAVARHALVMTLATFPTAFQEAAERSAQSVPAERSVRRAQRFMDEHASEAITVDDVAAAVHMSTRGLQYAFRRATDETPMQYLRRVRLHGAREDLERFPDESVAAIARRWGFAHPSRFAQQFREQFGRLPGDRRARPAEEEPKNEELHPPSAD